VARPSASKRSRRASRRRSIERRATTTRPGSSPRFAVTSTRASAPASKRRSTSTASATSSRAKRGARKPCCARGTASISGASTGAKIAAWLAGRVDALAKVASEATANAAAIAGRDDAESVLVTIGAAVLGGADALAKSERDLFKALATIDEREAPKESESVA